MVYDTIYQSAEMIQADYWCQLVEEYMPAVEYKIGIAEFHTSTNLFSYKERFWLTADWTDIVIRQVFKGSGTVINVMADGTEISFLCRLGCG